MPGKILARFRASRWAWLEPWYDWGTINAFRMDCRTLQEEEASCFDVWRVGLHWLGIYVELHFGRVPAKITSADRRKSA